MQHTECTTVCCLLHILSLCRLFSHVALCSTVRLDLSFLHCASLTRMLPLSTSLSPSLSLGPFSFHPHAKSNHHLRGNGWSCDLHLFLWLVATRWSHLAPHTHAHSHTHTNTHSSSLGCLLPSLPPSFFMASLLFSIPSSPPQLFLLSPSLQLLCCFNSTTLFWTIFPFYFSLV